MQILGPDDTRVERTSPADGFWADEHALALGHTTRGIPLRRPSSPAAFARFVEEGFQFTSTRHQGVYADASWSYEVTPLLGWGGEWPDAGDIVAQRCVATLGPALDGEPPSDDVGAASGHA